MASPTVGPGQDVPMDDIKLDDLSLDDDALFADLDNEVRLESSGDDGFPLDGKTDDLNLDFDVKAVGTAPKTASKPGAAKGGGSNGRGAPSDDFALDLDDSKLGGALDLDLESGDATTGGGDLNLDLGDAPAGGGDAHLDLDCSGRG